MTHRWEAIAAELRGRVALGDHGPAGEIGSEQQLGDEFGVSRITVRRALTQLRDEGLLLSGRGRGWRVAGTAAGEPIGWFRITGAGSDGVPVELTTEVLSFEMIDAPAELRALAAGPALRMVKLVSAAGTPFDCTTVTIAAPFAELITQRELRGSPPARLLATKGCMIGRTDQHVTAAVATPADEALGVEVGDALLVVDRTVYDADDHAVLRTLHRHPGWCTRIELTFPTTDQSDTPPVRVLRDR